MTIPLSRHTAPGITAPVPRIGGMLIGYYMICPRKAWLSMQGLWMEQESDAVAIGRLIDQTSYSRKRKSIDLTAPAPDGTPLVGRIDWTDLREGVLHETKKSRAVEDAHRWQLKFYLWLLKLSGVTRADGEPFTGMLNYPRLKRTEPVELAPEDEVRLAEMVAALRQIAAESKPPPRITRRSFCRKCAFEELCYG
jgi:CRISPR-associated exonuclease Cas4